MPINTVTLATSVYDRRLKDFIQAAEEAKLDVYVDFAGQGKRGTLQAEITPLQRGGVTQLGVDVLKLFVHLRDVASAEVI